MSKVRHIDFYPDEYIAGVGGSMSAEEQGVFWMVCSLISSHGGEVDNDPKRIGRLVCLGSNKNVLFLRVICIVEYLDILIHNIFDIFRFF